MAENVAKAAKEALRQIEALSLVSEVEKDGARKVLTVAGMVYRHLFCLSALHAGLGAPRAGVD